jgi:hypothetical protein
MVEHESIARDVVRDFEIESTGRVLEVHDVGDLAEGGLDPVAPFPR